MLISYSYITNDNKEFGFYQTDSEDFKKFFKNYKSKIRCLIAKLPDKIYIWQPEFYIKGKKFGGWQLAKKK